MKHKSSKYSEFILFDYLLALTPVPRSPYESYTRQSTTNSRYTYQYPPGGNHSTW